MKPLIAFFTFCALAASSPAAPEDNPTMTPESSAPAAQTESKNPFGMMGMGKERPKDAKTIITAETRASFDNATNVAEFEGHVVVQDPQFTLFCDRLKVTLAKDRKGMERTEAFGNVIIVQENVDGNGKAIKSTGRAEKAVYVPATGAVTLTGSPSVQQGINMQVGEPDTIMVLKRDGTSTTTGPSKTVIVDTGESN